MISKTTPIPAISSKAKKPKVGAKQVEHQATSRITCPYEFSKLLVGHSFSVPIPSSKTKSQIFSHIHGWFRRERLRFRIPSSYKILVRQESASSVRCWRIQ